MEEKTLLDRIDDLIFYWLFRDSAELRLKKYHEFYDTYFDEDEAEAIRNADLRSTEIDSKTASILTHISLMIAICLIALDTGEKNAWDWWIIFAELMAYIIVAFFTIRLCKIPPIPIEYGNNRAKLERSIRNLLHKREMYRVIQTWTTWLTVFLLPTLGFHFIKQVFG